jgi:hypothetical protein
MPVSSTFEEEIERGERSRCEVDPNSEEVRLWKATRAERRAAALKAHEEIMKGPASAYQIDQTLYVKAETRNIELTDEERALLQSRGDAVGKALAHPESLTTEETYQVCMTSQGLFRHGLRIISPGYDLVHPTYHPRYFTQ